MSLENYLKQCDLAYFNGKPLIADDVYDRLKQVDEVVGYKDDREERIPHTFPMWSLQKVFDGETTPPSWAENESVVITPKLDGSAVSILYIDGVYTLALTRGDGKKGVPITDKMKYLVPSQIQTDEKILQITGEVVAPVEIPNARNYAAGSLNLKDIEEFKQRSLDLVFVAYNAEPLTHEKWSHRLLELGEKGFVTVLTVDKYNYPTDGTVWRLDNVEEFYNLGFTSHHPRGAFAHKVREEGVTTTLLDVEWNVGKSGAVTPVAILEPVVIDDANISRATLHNAGFIEALNLEIGCKVEVIRSGKIIPKIVRRVE
tara:strand:- start:7128 stop:8072 length:945 start_codon:yes stop_codon:yes gene_type:complete